MSGGVPRLGLLDALGAAGAGLTLLFLSAPVWYEVNDGSFGAWRFHSWLDLAVAAFCAAALLVRAAPKRIGPVAVALGIVAVAMLVVRGVLGEPDLYNPSGEELDIASRSGGVFLCLFFAVWTLAAVATAARLRRTGRSLPPLRLANTGRADWVAAAAGFVLLWALNGAWYGTGYSSNSGFAALTVIDLALLVLGAAALLAPLYGAGRLVLPAAAGLVLVVIRTIWVPDTGFSNATYDERLPGLWVALVATAIMTASATARRRRST